MTPLLLALIFMLLSAAAHAAGCESPAGAGTKRAEVTIAGYNFDPLLDATPAPAVLHADESGNGQRWWLVQLRRSPTGAERTQLTSRYGLLLSRVVQGQGYLEQLDAQTAAELRCESSVRAVVAHQPAFKVSPALGKFPFDTARDKSLVVSVHDAASLDTIAAQARGLGGTEVEVISDVRFTLRLPDPTLIVNLARLDGVRWIEPRPVRNEDR